MRYLKPHFYDQFVCTAGDCPDTCCAGWQIVIDEDSLERYGNEKSEFGKRLRNSIDWEEECFYQNNRRCAFLNDENLCDLYIKPAFSDKPIKRSNTVFIVLHKLIRNNTHILGIKLFTCVFIFIFTEFNR